MSSNPPEPAPSEASAAGTTPDPARSGRRPITLRTKLIAGFVGAIIAVSAVIGVVTQVFLSDYLTAQLDQRVAATQFRLGGGPNGQSGNGQSGPSGAGQPDLPPGTPRIIDPADQLCSNPATTTDNPGARQPDDSLFAVLSPSTSPPLVTAAVRGQYPSCTTVPDAVALALLSVPTTGVVTTVSLGDLGDFRVVAREQTGGVVVSGLSTAGVDATQDRLLVILLIVAGSAVVLGGVAVWWSVRRALRPLEEVAAAARTVTALELHRGEVDLGVRLPDRLTDPRTEVGQVGGALDQLLVHVADALDSRQQSESRVRRFVADASHELRTPLAAIRGYAELAGRNPDDTPAVRHALGRVRSESERMSSLVDDLLLLARLDSGRPLDQDPVDLTVLAIDAVSDARVAGPDHRWQLDLPEEPILARGDGQRLHQVLANLLANARTHTAPGSTVVTGLRTERGRAVVTVTDDGEGIAPALQSEIFGRFVRGEQSRSRVAGSTGLGLAIVSAVVAAHHGTVAVQSRPGRTVFTVRLPLDTTPS